MKKGNKILLVTLIGALVLGFAPDNFHPFHILAGIFIGAGFSQWVSKS